MRSHSNHCEHTSQRHSPGAYHLQARPLWRLVPAQSLFALILYCAIATAQPTGPDATDSAVRKFLADAPAGWQAYKETLVAYKGTATDVKTKNEKTHSDVKVYFAKSNGNRKCIIERHLSGGVESEAHANNSDYAFSASKNLNKSAWAIRQIGKNKQAQAVVAENCDDCDTYLFSAFRAYTEDMSMLIKRPDFKVRSIRFEGSGATMAAVVHFTNEHAVGNPANQSLVQSGTVTMLPNLYWSIRDYDLTMKYGNGHGQTKGRFALRQQEGGKSQTWNAVIESNNTVDRDSGFVLRSNMECNIRFEAVPADEFTCTSFGLPEPRGAKPPVSWTESRFMWIIGAVLATLAIVFWMWLRKWSSQR